MRLNQRPCSACGKVTPEPKICHFCKKVVICQECTAKGEILWNGAGDYMCKGCYDRLMETNSIDIQNEDERVYMVGICAICGADEIMRVSCGCGRHVCRECIIVDKNKMEICEGCIEDGLAGYCNSCNEIECGESYKKCIECDTTFCPECLKLCESCGRPVCVNCFKNEHKCK